MAKQSVAWPLEMGRALFTESQMAEPFSESGVKDVVGELVIQLFDELGPLYGKAGQIALSRLRPEAYRIAEQLQFTRLYQNWPPISFPEVEVILDREIPRWRTELDVQAYPLGVASLGQVHAATDREGEEWVLKIIRPQAEEKLLRSVAALEQVIMVVRPFVLTRQGRRIVHELREVCQGLRGELSLKRERQTIERVHELLRSKRQKVLMIPGLYEDFCTDRVLTVERFRGTPFKDIVADDTKLSAKVRQKLARTVLQELLIQIFELGFFHADPHAGNLILTEDGNVGLFDWGLAGELLESDRRHIAAMLKAVIAMDVEQLIDALIDLAQEGGVNVTRAKVERELRGMIKLVRAGQQEGGKRPSLQKLLEISLKGAGKLEIPIPEGLLMMAKSLVTIEGLARGIDPKVSMARIAAPVVLRAARPGVKDLLSFGKRIPALARTFMRGSK